VDHFRSGEVDHFQSGRSSLRGAAGSDQTEGAPDVMNPGVDAASIIVSLIAPKSGVTIGTIWVTSAAR